MRTITLILAFILLSAAILTAQVQINEVLYNTASASDDRVELKNFGAVAVDVSSWQLCSKFVYWAIGSLTAEIGSTTIPAGGFLVLSGVSLDNSADLGLYNSSAFTSTTAMQDFVQWGSAGNGRESVAVSKGIWSTGAFHTGVDQGHSIEYDGAGNDPGDWGDTDTPTLGEENSNVTSVDESFVIPADFALEQNFPNPFNPSTVIKYMVSQSANLTNIRLEIFNVLGQKVRTLVNTKQSSGTYTVQWDGTDDFGRLLANGVYVYRLSAGAQVEMKKMLFLK